MSFGSCGLAFGLAGAPAATSSTQTSREEMITSIPMSTACHHYQICPHQGIPKAIVSDIGGLDFSLKREHKNSDSCKLVSMAEELQPCPVCAIGRLKPTGLAAISRGEERNEVKNDIGGYKCDNPDCGYPEAGNRK